MKYRVNVKKIYMDLKLDFDDLHEAADFMATLVQHMTTDENKDNVDVWMTMVEEEVEA